MNDCLVTKLKGVVDNDNLLKIGEFIININAQEVDTHSNMLCLSGATSVRVIGDGLIALNDNTPNTKNVTLSPGNEYITFGSGIYKLAVASKYDLYSYTEASKYSKNYSWQAIVNLEDLVYAQDSIEIACSALSIANKYAPLSKLKNKKTIYISGGNSELGGRDNDILIANISELAGGNIQKLGLFAQNTITGNINDLGTCLNLIRLDLRFDKRIEGDIDTMAATMAANGKTSSLIIPVNASVGFKDGGNIIDAAYIQSKGFTNQMTITITFNGGTYTKQYS